jgi:anti-sigma factor RsiW
MLNCKQLTELATSYAEGGLDPATTRRVEDHLGTCQGCRTWLAQLTLTARLLRSLPRPEVTAEARDAALRQFDAWQAARAAGRVSAAAEGRVPDIAGRVPDTAHAAHGAQAGPGRRVAVALLAVFGLAALLVLVARKPSIAAGDWAVAGALSLAAIGLAALVRRLTARFAATAVSASLVAALVRGGAGSWDLAAGLECLVTELAAAAGLVAVGWLAARRRLDPGDLGVWAVAGALAGDAALHVTCGSHGSLAHLALFHVGGVLLTALLAGWAVRRARGAPVAA